MTSPRPWRMGPLLAAMMLATTTALVGTGAALAPLADRSGAAVQSTCPSGGQQGILLSGCCDYDGLYRAIVCEPCNVATRIAFGRECLG